jgi:hypothetical protein
VSKLESEERRLAIVKKQLGSMASLLKCEKIKLKQRRKKLDEDADKAQSEKF